MGKQVAGKHEGEYLLFNLVFCLMMGRGQKSPLCGTSDPSYDYLVYRKEQDKTGEDNKWDKKEDIWPYCERYTCEM